MGNELVDIIGFRCRVVPASKKAWNFEFAYDGWEVFTRTTQAGTELVAVRRDRSN